MMRFPTEPIIGYLGIHLLSSKRVALEAYRYAFNDDSLIPKSSVEKSAEFLDMPLAKYAYKESVDDIIPDDVNFIESIYNRISIPTLIVWGREDISIPYQFALKLHRDIANSRVVILPDVGHMPQEESPSILLYIMNSFLSSTK